MALDLCLDIFSPYGQTSHKEGKTIQPINVIYRWTEGILRLDWRSQSRFGVIDLNASHSQTMFQNNTL